MTKHADNFIIFAHRGARALEPENTLRAFAKALELGATWIELDVYLVEGRLVVIHDKDLSRTTDGRGKVTQSSLEYLRSLDAGKGEKIPFLEEVLDLVDRRARINIEIKARGTAAAVADLIEGYVKKGWEYDDFLVSSFRHSEIRRFKKICPAVRTGALIKKPRRLGLGFARRAQAWSINISLEYVSPPFIQRAHTCGYPVFVYTVNTPADIRRLREWGADGIFSDHAEYCLEYGDGN